MISVEQLIGDLLLRHNCVIVPSFGGFVANQTSAVIDYANGVMTPPKKSLMFNRQLVNNDGLLVAEFATQNNFTYDTSKTFIDELVQSWNELLKKGERVTLDRVGHLYFDQEKNICFEQDRFFNLLLESYGLGKVHFITEEDTRIAAHQANHTTENEEAMIKVIDFDHIERQATSETVIIEHPILKEKTKVWRYIAAACLLPIAFYSFWLPVRTDVLESGMLSFKDFNPFYKSVDGQYTSHSFKVEKAEPKVESLEEMVSKLPSDVEVFSYPFDADLYIPIKVHGESTINLDTVEPITVENKEITPTGNFNIIVGCFGDANNAKNLVAKLKSEGFNAFIVDEMNGLSRVSIGNVNSNNAAIELSSKAKSLGYSGWILKK